MNKRISFVIVFVSGIAVTALEIASARLAAPYFGSTIYVWGGAIGTVLAALALGYWLGGKVIDRIYAPKVVTWVLLVAATTIELIPLFSTQVNTNLLHAANAWHSPIGFIIVVSMLSLFFIPLVCLGMMSPMILRLSLTTVEEAGGWSGALSGGATFGSIVGTFLAAYWTIPFFGTRATIVMAGAVLFLLAFMTSKIQKRVSVLVGALVLLSAVQASVTQLTPRAHVVWAKESPYQYVQTVEVDGVRYLVHDAAMATQSSYAPAAPNGPGPYDIFAVLPFLTGQTNQHRSVLLLGLGGGNMVRTFQRELGTQFTFDITAVEIDPVVIQAAQQYFGLQKHEANLVVDDARHYLRTTDKQYDIIIVDAYTHEMQIPPMLATREFFQEIHDHLNPNGLLGMNAFVTPGSRYIEKLRSTITSVFQDVRDVPFARNSPNHLIVAGQSINVDRLPRQLAPTMTVDVPSAIERMTVVSPGGPIYTDDRTDLELRVRPFVAD